MSGKVHLKGHIDVPENRLAAVEAALPEHTALTRAEQGCTSFNVDPCPDVPGRFLVAETFNNQQAFDAHQERTKASIWAEVTKNIPREYSIELEDPD